MTEEQILDALTDNYNLDPIYDDTFKSKQIERARKKFSEFYPEKCIGYIPSVSGQTRYQVNVDGDAPEAPNLIKITKIYYGKDTSENTIDGIVNSTAQERGMPNMKSTFMPSSGFEFVQRMQILSMLVPAEGFIVSHNKFDLIPTPTVTGDRIYFEYDSYRELADFPDIFEEDFVNFVLFAVTDRSFTDAQLKQSGNKYNFDRRGNISVDSDSVSARKDHEESRNSIYNSVKTKAMKLG